MFNLPPVTLYLKVLHWAQLHPQAKTKLNMSGVEIGMGKPVPGLQELLRAQDSEFVVLNWRLYNISSGCHSGNQNVFPDIMVAFTHLIMWRKHVL